jgi:hypothetical protein
MTGVPDAVKICVIVVMVLLEGLVMVEFEKVANAVEEVLRWAVSEVTKVERLVMVELV